MATPRIKQLYKGLPKENDVVIAVIENLRIRYVYKPYKKDYRFNMPCDNYCDLMKDGFCCCVECKIGFGYRFQRSSKCRKIKASELNYCRME